MRNFRVTAVFVFEQLHAVSEHLKPGTSSRSSNKLPIFRRLRVTWLRPNKCPWFCDKLATAV